MKGDDPNLARVVMVTHPGEAEAKSMAAKLVENGVAACVTVVPGATSIYKDGDRLVEASEVQMFIKTREGMIGPLKHRITKMHPYDNPELLVLPTDGGSGKFIEWITNQTSS